MKIKALLFDFDETLFVNEDSTRESVRYAWQSVEKDYPNIPIERVVDAYMDSRDKFWHVDDTQVIPEIQQGAVHVRRVLWTMTFKTLGIQRDDVLDTLVQRFGEKRYETWRLYPESIDILNQLKTSYKLVIVTNGISEIQRGKIKKVQVESYFHPILVSGELGISKPDPRFLYQAADTIDVKYSECVMIGDSVRNDIGGAKNARMISVWVNRNGHLPRPSIIPDYEIKTLRELPVILKTLE
jgi:putative hydrolase of the HAD superfamily